MGTKLKIFVGGSILIFCVFTQSCNSGSATQITRSFVDPNNLYSDFTYSVFRSGKYHGCVIVVESKAALIPARLHNGGLEINGDPVKFSNLNKIYFTSGENISVQTFYQNINEFHREEASVLLISFLRKNNAG